MCAPWYGDKNAQHKNLILVSLNSNYKLISHAHARPIWLNDHDSLHVDILIFLVLFYNFTKYTCIKFCGDIKHNFETKVSMKVCILKQIKIYHNV